MTEIISFLAVCAALWFVTRRNDQMREKTAEELRIQLVRRALLTGFGALSVVCSTLTVNHLAPQVLAVVGPAGTAGGALGGVRTRGRGAGGSGGGGGCTYTAPNTPTVDAVVFAVTGDSLRVVGNAFSGSCDDTHDSTAFQVDSAGKGFGSPQYHSVVLGPVTTDTAIAIDSGATVDIRMRYKGAAAKSATWSAWDTLAGVQMVVAGVDTIVFHNFNDSTLGGTYTNPWGASRPWVFPNDPTSSGRGRVAQTTYAPAVGDSQERGFQYLAQAGDTLKVAGDTVWFKGDLYIPDNSGADADWSNNHNRKLIDWQSGSTNARIIFNRQTGNDLKFAAENANGPSGTFEVSTGVSILKDTWYEIVVMVVPNTQGNSDGVMQLYVNNSTSTPDYERTDLNIFQTGDHIIYYLTGYQLTIDVGHTGPYPDPRYWDNVGLYRQDPR